MKKGLVVSPERDIIKKYSTCGSCGRFSKKITKEGKRG
jgi:hypothetical protein